MMLGSIFLLFQLRLCSVLKTSEIEIMTDSNKNVNTLLCPSARSDWEGSQVFGVVHGTVEVPKVAYLKKAQPLLDNMEKLKNKVTPEEVFRIAAPCEEKGCQHFDGQDCRLVMRAVDQLPVVVESLPPCAIRRSCRWWQQEGRSACLRCPQLITDNHSPSELMINVATPE
jgi:hypothetical protein